MRLKQSQYRSKRKLSAINSTKADLIKRLTTLIGEKVERKGEMTLKQLKQKLKQKS